MVTGIEFILGINMLLYRSLISNWDKSCQWYPVLPHTLVSPESHCHRLVTSVSPATNTEVRPRNTTPAADMTPPTPAPPGHLSSARHWSSWDLVPAWCCDVRLDWHSIWAGYYRVAICHLFDGLYDMNEEGEKIIVKRKIVLVIFL